MLHNFALKNNIPDYGEDEDLPDPDDDEDNIGRENQNGLRYRDRFCHEHFGWFKIVKFNCEIFTFHSSGVYSYRFMHIGCY